MDSRMKEWATPNMDDKTLDVMGKTMMVDAEYLPEGAIFLTNERNEKICLNPNGSWGFID